MSWIYEAARSTPREVYQAIEKEAARIPLSMYALCQHAEVDPATVNRWKSCDAQPSFRIVRDLMSVVIFHLKQQGIKI